MSGKFKKELGLMDLTLSAIGLIIGAGIYSIIGISAKHAKNYTWISVILCCIFAICTGLSYAELGVMFNNNGGEHLFTKEAFNNNMLANIVGIFIFIGEILLLNTVAFGLGSYLTAFIPLKIPILAGISLLLSSYLNYSGIRNSINFNNIATVLEIIGLVLISVLGLFNINKNIFDLSKINTKSMFDISIGSAFLYFAFFGFDILVELIEETKNVEKNLPKALIYGVGVSSILYLGVTISAISTIGWKKLSESSSPMVDIATKLFNGNMGFIVMIIAIISMSNTLLMGNVGSSRFIQNIAKDTKFPFNLHSIDKNTNTPKNAILLITIITMFGLLFGNLENIATATNIFTIFVFFIVNICVISLRIKKPDHNRPFKIPFNINNIPITSLIGASSSIIFIVILLKYKFF